MALEEVAAETAADGGPATVRVYGWPDTLSLGFGGAYDAVDRAFCEREGIEVTRRRTGGGGVYHDATGEVSYSIVAPAGACSDELSSCYREFCAPVLDALDRLGVNAGFADERREGRYEPACYLREVNPAHDIVGSDGRKIAGNAQYRRRNAVIQHGSLSVSVRARRHAGCFADGPGPEAIRERVGAIERYAGATRSEVFGALRDALAEWAGAEPGEWSEDELDRAEALARETYASEEWLRRV
jgi:lipoate-protein ligase A